MFRTLKPGSFMQILQIPCGRPPKEKTLLSGLGNSWVPLCFHGYPIHTGLAQRSTTKCASTHGKFMELYWLVVYQLLWQIWKSVGMIIPKIWKNKKCSKPPTRRSHNSHKSQEAKKPKSQKLFKQPQTGKPKNKNQKIAILRKYSSVAKSPVACRYSPT